MLNIYLFQSLFWFLNFGFYLFCKLKNALVVNGFFDSILSSKLTSQNKSRSNKLILWSITWGCTQKMSPTIPNLNCMVLKLHRFKERWNRCEIWNWWKRVRGQLLKSRLPRGGLSIPVAYLNFCTVWTVNNDI